MNVDMEVCNLFICKVFFPPVKDLGTLFLTLLVIKLVPKHVINKSVMFSSS